MATPAKRKRVVHETFEPEDSEDVQAVFRRAFEAQFMPLAAESKRLKVVQDALEDDGDDDVESQSEWSGISEDEAHDVHVIEYRDPQREQDGMDKAQRKAFMSSKPPTSAAASTGNLALKQKQRQQQDKADPTETTNLKNDHALQKLLRDSHLLSASSSGTSIPTLSAAGSVRHKSTDLHLQSLGARSSVFSQKKMPMAQRKHEAQKARLLEEKRRAHAKDAGIVLEREKKVGRTHADKKREKGVGGPSIGKFKRGVLSLTNRDVRSIVGGGASAKGKGKSRAKNGRR